MAREPITRRFRITAPLPLTVVFPSIAYTLDISQTPGGGEDWRLKASGPKGVWLMAEGYRTKEALLHDITQTGITAPPVTVPELILKRLVQEHRAEMVE